LVVLHAENMGYKQGLRNLVETARLAAGQRRNIRFVLMGDGNERKSLEALAAGLDNVEFLDPEPGDVFMDVLAAAHVLLINERPSVVNMSLPSKITSYFAAGRPVVAAVSRDGATATELTRSGGALVVPAGDPPSPSSGPSTRCPVPPRWRSVSLTPPPALSSRLSTRGSCLRRPRGSSRASPVGTSLEQRPVGPTPRGGRENRP
jgi:hypothetical protein